MVNQERVKEALNILMDEASVIESYEEYEEVNDYLEKLAEIFQMN